jgi:FlaA1/EpsC-like NDP-sugar epimerase
MATMAATHVVLFLVAWFVSFCTRWDFQPDARMLGMFRGTVVWVVVVKTLVFLLHGQFRWLFGRLSFADLGRLAFTTTLATLALVAIDVFRDSVGDLPGLRQRLSRSVLVIDWAATLFLIGGLRALPRTIREVFRPWITTGDVRSALIVGATETGELLARNLVANQSPSYIVVGFLDDNALLRGSRIAGIRVLGGVGDALTVLRQRPVDEILVPAGEISRPVFRRLLSDAAEFGASVKVIPSMGELLAADGADASPSVLRPVEIRDLLRREPVVLDDSAIEGMVRDRVVLVTGGGGSIGSEICRQILRYRPRRLVVVERAENALFDIGNDLQSRGAGVPMELALADILDESRMRCLFETHRPDLVFHAAAHKHVSMLEHNPAEAITNNCFGTRLLARLAEEYAVGRFVAISTDKAVNPASVMGCSKLIAERFVQAFAATARTKFVVVRFGNVLGSNGSVVPKFRDQILRGGPVTVTHPDVERFFMTISEASQLVIQAAALGRGGEIFLLDMGAAVKIVDLARDMISLSGSDEEEIGIEYTGLKRGEKLAEELFSAEESRVQTSHPKVCCVVGRTAVLEDVERLFNQLKTLPGEPPDVIREGLRRIVPEYRSSALCGPEGSVVGGREGDKSGAITERSARGG